MTAALHLIEVTGRGAQGFTPAEEHDFLTLVDSLMKTRGPVSEDEIQLVADWVHHVHVLNALIGGVHGGVFVLSGLNGTKPLWSVASPANATDVLPEDEHAHDWVTVYRRGGEELS